VRHALHVNAAIRIAFAKNGYMKHGNIVPSLNGKLAQRSHYFALMLFFRQRQGEERLDRLCKSLGTARFKIDFAAACADPGFEARKFYADTLLLELLRNCFALYSPATL
jgi:hypothetical protein